MKEAKMQVAKKAYIEIQNDISADTVLGIGTGSTVDCFIDILGKERPRLKGAVSSSERSTNLLRSIGIKVYGLNDVTEINYYIDGADEVDGKNFLIKGGGGAMTREKIVAAASNIFICIVDSSKIVSGLGGFGIPIEVLSESLNYVTQEIKKLGGNPILRDGFITDSGNQIIDIKDINIADPLELEKTLNSIPGVVENGIFAQQRPNLVLVD